MESGEQISRHDRRLVTPVLERVGPVAVWSAPQEGVEGAGIVGAKSGEERQVVCACEHVHGVELQHALPVKVRGEVLSARPSGTTLARQTLGVEEDPPRLSRTERLGHDRHCSGAIRHVEAPISYAAPGSGTLVRLAPIAQSVERFHGKEKVQGVIPCRGSQ